MADNGSILSASNQATVIVVCFVLAMLATVLGLYDMLQIRNLGAAVQEVNSLNVASIESQLKATTTRLAAIEKRLGDLETRSAAVPAGADPAAAPVAAPEGKAGKKAQ